MEFILGMLIGAMILSIGMFLGMILAPKDLRRAGGDIRVTKYGGK